MKTTGHRHYFQPYLAWIACAIVGALLASSASAQCWHRWPTPNELAQWTAQRKLEARAKHASTRFRVAKARLARIEARLKKLDKRIKGWEDELPALQRRIWGLEQARRPRHTTMRRSLGSLIADVRRKMAQREGWIKAGRREERQLLDERQERIGQMVDAERLIRWRKGR